MATEFCPGAAAGVLLALAMMGCVMQPNPKTVHWDLRQGHAKTAVGWPAEADDVYEVDRADLTLDLPGGRRFQARGVSLRLFAAGDQVQVVAVMYPKTTLDDGYRQARSLSQEWQLRTDDLERWRQEVVAGRARGVRDADERAFVVMAGSLLAPGGPTPYAKTLDSQDAERPFLLDLEFQWV
ncbi:MAG TPA: hypothetical protein VLW53_17245 [Candidatus Eisenbacteria bacterium]|nr:hypothetical protein [Candidatus Eisenbacteria bacterium]